MESTNGDSMNESNGSKQQVDKSETQDKDLIHQENENGSSDSVDPKDVSQNTKEVYENNGAKQNVHNGETQNVVLIQQENEHGSFDSLEPEEVYAEEKSEDPVFDGTESPELEAARSSLGDLFELDSESRAPAWPGKAVAIKNYVKQKSTVAVSTLLRRLSGKKDGEGFPERDEKNDRSVCDSSEPKDSSTESEMKETQQKLEEQSIWNPLNYIKIGRGMDTLNKAKQADQEANAENSAEPIMRGRIIVYTRFGCQDCKMVRSFMHQRRLKYVEINIDIFPSRKLELEKNTGSSSVPKVYFNDLLIGGLGQLKAMEESGIIDEMVNDLFTKEPSAAAPLPPLPGEDDESGSGKIDELATIVQKMKEFIAPKDRFYKMRRFSNCFLGLEAVDFLSEDQYLEREEAVEFARKLASKHFFRHILDENIFEDGSHLYRFLDHDPIILSQCYNIPRGIIDVIPKPVVEIASRLRLLAYAIFEAYASEDGRHVDYRSIHGCEEFKRYIRITEELQRVELDDLSREEKLAFFINLYNMMAIHAILTRGHPAKALDRRKFFGDFKYVIGGCPYSLSAIQNGVLRGNQRPPYNLSKPFGPRDRRSKVALPYPESLVHFALVCGTKSGPALRTYSPGNIDKELMEAARDFLRNGGFVVDAEAKVASVSRILRWYGTDFGNNEVEVMKHAANYLEPAKSEELLTLLANTQMKVTYQPYDWALNI